MEFHEKLQAMRKQRGLTQEELAAALYVSRTAVSKWESGRGFPSIDSLKAIAGFFSVSIDALLSGDELLTIAGDDSRQKEKSIRDLVFGLLDCSMAAFLFLPLFGQTADGVIREVSLLALSGVSGYLRLLYFAVVAGTVLTGLMTLALQSCRPAIWERGKIPLSLGLGAFAALLFILSRQPYAAAFAFIFLMIKVFMVVRLR